MEIENIIYRRLNRADRNDVADLYCKVFAGDPWFEDFWTRESALGVLDKAMMLDGFIGTVAEKQNQIIGFSFGYPLPEKNTENIAFSQVRQLFNGRGIEGKSVFYGAETGVLPELQNKGIGTNMFDYRMQLVKNAGYQGVASRTINLAMVRVYEKVFGEDQVQSIFKDPVKTERTWYYVHLKESNKKKQENKNL